MNIARRCLFHNITSKSCRRSYAFKSDLKIKWVRPEKVLCIKPQKSGDLESMPAIDLSQPRMQFRNSQELATANETVKKLFSLEYAPRKELAQVYFEQVKDMVRRHNFDSGSIEVRIARWTAIIRAYQELMEKYPRDRVMTVILKELIDKRKKHLKYLRRWDYKKFEWLLEALNLEYKPPPVVFHRIERKDSLRKLTDKYCGNVKEERLEAYKKMLQDEQPVFLEEKIRALEFIRNEQRECGAEITVSAEEIDAVRQQLEELQEKQRNVNDE